MTLESWSCLDLNRVGYKRPRKERQLGLGVISAFCCNERRAFSQAKRGSRPEDFQSGGVFLHQGHRSPLSPSMSPCALLILAKLFPFSRWMKGKELLLPTQRTGEQWPISKMIMSSQSIGIHVALDHGRI